MTCARGETSTCVDHVRVSQRMQVHQFAPISMHFANGVELPLPPGQYAYELRHGVWCLGVFDNGHSGVVIGACNMRNNEVRLGRTPPSSRGPRSPTRPHCPASTRQALLQSFPRAVWRAVWRAVSRRHTGDFRSCQPSPRLREERLQADVLDESTQRPHRRLLVHRCRTLRRAPAPARPPTTAVLSPFYRSFSS